MPPYVLKDKAPRNADDATQQAKMLAMLDELMGKGKGAEMEGPGGEMESPMEDVVEPGEEAMCPACGQPLPSPEGDEVAPMPEDAPEDVGTKPAGPARLSSIEDLLAKAKKTPIA